MPAGYEQGKQLQDVANSLRGFSSDIGEIADRRYAAFRAATDRQADQLALTHSAVLQNQQDIKGAVDRGEIPGHSNPWLMVRLKQDVARNEVQTAQASVYNDLRQSDIFHKDDPNAVSNFINQRFGAMAQGRDAWQIAAMQPAVQQAHAKMMDDWSNVRGQERMEEAHTATGAGVLASINNHMGDTSVLAPEAVEKMPGMLNDLQDHYNQLNNVVDKATASKWISEAAFQAGRIHRSADLTRSILDGVKGQDGLKLSSLADNKAELETLPREIEQLSLADERTHNELTEQKANTESLNLMAKAKDWMKDQGVTNPMEVKIPQDVLEKESPLVVANLYHRLAEVSADYTQNKNSQFMATIEPSVGQAMKAIADGKFDQNGYMKLGTVLASAGDPGKNAMETVTRMWLQQRGIAEGITKPESVSQLTYMAQAGTLTTDKVFDMNAKGLLDKSDTIHYATIAAQVQADSGKSSPMVQSALAKLHRQVEATFLADDGGILPGHDNTNKMKIAVDSSTDAFLGRFYTDLAQRPGWAQATPEEQSKQVQDLVDWASHQAGGMTDAERMKKFSYQKQEEKPLNRFNPISEVGKLPADEQRVQAGDPMTIDRQTVKSLGSIINFDVKHPPVHELMKYLPQNNDPTWAGWEGGNGVVDRLKFTRNMLPILSDENWSKVDLKAKTVGGDGVGGQMAYDMMNEEVRQRDSALDSLQQMKPDVQQAQQRLAQISQQFLRQGKVDLDTQQEARQLTLKYLAYTELRKQVGYSPDEVKQMGEGAWRLAPMFANPVDLNQRGEEVAKTLNIPESLHAAFIKRQLDLIKYERHNPSTEETNSK